MVLGRCKRMEGKMDKGRKLGELGGRASKTYGSDRICLEAGCNQKLSIYNHKLHCYVHNKFTQPRVRGRDIIEI